MDRRTVIALEREFFNAARRWRGAGNLDKAEAYRHVAWRLRQELKEQA